MLFDTELIPQHSYSLDTEASCFDGKPLYLDAYDYYDDDDDNMTHKRKSKKSKSPPYYIMYSEFIILFVILIIAIYAIAVL